MVTTRQHQVDDDGSGVVIARGQHSPAAYMLPSSVRRLPVKVQRGLHDLAEIGGQIRHLDDHIDQVVPDLRAGGASWAQIGAALGITGETARQRYRVLLSDDDS